MFHRDQQHQQRGLFEPGCRPVVIVGVCTECLAGLESRRSDLS
jgi:hypothetical protein